MNCSRFHSAILIALSIVLSNIAAEESDIPKISVSGTGEVRVVPDRVELTFSVESRGKDLDKCVDDNNAKINAVLTFLGKSQIEKRDIRTEMININPIYPDRSEKFGKVQIAQQSFGNASAANIARDDKQKFDVLKPIGYSAKRGLRVTIRELDNFESIYRGLIKNGVNDVGGFQFQTSKLRVHKDKARLEAIRAAREKAAALAKELGASLKAVHSIEETYGFRSPNFSNQLSFVAGSSDSSVAAGEIEIKATVAVVFRLGDTEMED